MCFDSCLLSQLRHLFQWMPVNVFFCIVFSFGSTSDGCFFHIGTCYLAGISSSTLPGYDAVVDYAALLSANSEGWKKDRISDDFEANSNCFSKMADQTVVPTWWWRLPGTASRRWPKLDSDLHIGADGFWPNIFSIWNAGPSARWWHDYSFVKA